MKTVLIVMTLMGCDCDAKVCEYIKTADTGWSNMETCRADLEAQIRKAGKVDYPLITATCAASAQQSPMIAAIRSKCQRRSLTALLKSLPWEHQSKSPSLLKSAL